MSPRTQTRPLDDPKMWRGLVACTHPDAAGGDHDLFIWTRALEDAVCGGELRIESKTPPRLPEPRREPPPPGPDRVPVDDGSDFGDLTDRALAMAGQVPSTFGDVLMLLQDCQPAEEGALLGQQTRGATYKQLAALAYRAGFEKSDRVQWYRLAESIPLSQRHAGHMLGRIKHVG